MTLIYLLIYFIQLAFYASWMHPESVQIALTITFILALCLLIIIFSAEKKGEKLEGNIESDLLFIFNTTALLVEGAARWLAI